MNANPTDPGVVYIIHFGKLPRRKQRGIRAKLFMKSYITPDIMSAGPMTLKDD